MIGTKLKDFKEALGEGKKIPQIAELRKDVTEFARQFPVVGFELDSMKYDV